MIRRLERLPLGTSYPAIGTRLVTLVDDVAAKVGGQHELFLDATGVGTPVLDALNASGIKAHLTGDYFTHGDRRTIEKGEICLGMAWLVSRLQALSQRGRLRLPNAKEARALAEELLDYEIRIDEGANGKHGAFKVGTHDDLVTALGLAAQLDPAASVTAVGIVQMPDWLSRCRGEARFVAPGETAGVVAR